MKILDTFFYALEYHLGMKAIEHIVKILEKESLSMVGTRVGKGSEKKTRHETRPT